MKEGKSERRKGFSKGGKKKIATTKGWGEKSLLQKLLLERS